MIDRALGRIEKLFEDRVVVFAFGVLCAVIYGA